MDYGIINFSKLKEIFKDFGTTLSRENSYGIDCRGLRHQAHDNLPFYFAMKWQQNESTCFIN